MLALGPQRVASTSYASQQQLEPHTSSKRIRGLRIDHWRIDLESTTLSNIRSHIGKGTIVRGAGKNADVRQLCYLTGGPRGEVTLLFESSELGGTEAAVTGFKLVRGRVRGATCDGIRLTIDQVVLDREVRLGMSGPALRASIGANPRREGEYLVFEGTMDIPAASPSATRPGTGDYSVYYGLRARLVKNNVQSVYVWQVSSS